jgi:structure-specific recognition protein 1
LFQKSSKKEVSSSKPPAKRKPKSGDAEGSEKKKAKKKKKDPNAPKRAIAPFMYFSKTERVVSYLHPSIFKFSAFMVKKI